MNSPQPPRTRLWKLTASWTARESAAILLVSGRIGQSTAGEFEGAIREVMSRGVVQIALDLAGVTYLSSAGLGVIRSVSDELPAKGGQLTVRSPADPARLALDLAGLSHLISE